MNSVHLFYGFCLVSAFVVFVIYSTAFHPPKNKILPLFAYTTENFKEKVKPGVESDDNCDQNARKQDIPPPWQEFQHADLTFFLYGAYWDERRANSEAVRIAAVVQDGDRSKIRMFCHFWWGNENVSTTQAASYHVIAGFEKRHTIRFIIVTCPTSRRFLISHSKPQHPRAVSLAPTGSPTTCKYLENLMPVVFNPLLPGDTKLNFAVCHKALYYHKIDPSKLIIDWFEIQRILGFKKVFVYEYFQHPNISKVLQHYIKEGFAELKQYLIPFARPEPEEIIKYIKTYLYDSWVNELVCYHDCFFRNMYHFKYITLLDIDEFFMPIKHRSLGELVQLLEAEAVAESSEPVAGFVFQNNVFPDSDDFQPQLVPKDNQYTNSHMLQHFVRLASPNISDKTKLLFNTSEALGLHNHYLQFSLSHWETKDCRVLYVDPQVARNHHYCLNKAKSCANVDRAEMQLDTTMWRFKDELHNATTKVRLLLELDH